jgi:acetyl-CoA carboxylase biotin carboxylase subunit
MTQADVRVSGHSIECRINAEDPERFLPTPGRITTFRLPGGPGVRVDTHAYSGYHVPPFYDSLLAKLIVHAPTREEAVAVMRRALDEMQVEGVKTTIPIHQRILQHPDFLAGRISTQFLTRLLRPR